MKHSLHIPLSKQNDQNKKFMIQVEYQQKGTVIIQLQMFIIFWKLNVNTMTTFKTPVAIPSKYLNPRIRTRT